MSIDRKYPANDLRLKNILEKIYVAIDQLQVQVAERPTGLSSADLQSIAKQVQAGLIGPFGAPVIGQGSDPKLQNLGLGSVTNVSRINNANFLAATITDPSGAPIITFDPVPATGWGTPSSTLIRTTFATYAGQTCSIAYVQAEAQATDDAVKAVSRRLGALITDLITQEILAA